MDPEGNCTAKTTSEIATLKDASVEQIKAIRVARNSINYGLYQRTLALKGDANGEWVVTVPMKFLNIFFGHQMYFPCRTLINVELVMSPDKKILVVKDGENAAEKFKLSVKAITLNLRYATFEDKLRDRYMSTINRLSLSRSFQSAKEVSYSLKAKSKLARMESLFNFQQIPGCLTILFVQEDVSNGDRLHNRFSYQNMDVSKIAIFKGGKPHHTNDHTVNMSIRKGNFWHLKWYRDFVELYGERSKDITPECFFDDLFLFTFNLSPNQIVDKQMSVSETPSDRKLNLVEAGSLNVVLEFNTTL